MSRLSHLKGNTDALFDRPDDAVVGTGGVADALAWACLRASLPVELRRRIRRGDTVAVIVQVPGADRCGPLARAVRKDLHQVVCVTRDGSHRRDHDPAHGSDGVAADLASGHSVVGVSQDPQRFLPSALLSAADARVFDVAPSLRFPPVECCNGVSPSRAAKSRPLKVSAGGASAATAVAITGLIPGMLVRRRATSSSLPPSSEFNTSTLLIEAVEGRPHHQNRTRQIAPSRR